MKSFIFNPLNVDPHDVARHDYLEFFVEKILSHRGDLRLRGTLEFHVKWLGYDESRNTLKLFAIICHAKQPHEYLVSQNLKSLIPQKFR